MAAELYSPPSPLGDSLLDSPLCGDLIEDLRKISASIGDNSLEFDFPECQSNDSGPKSSVMPGKYRDPKRYLKMVLKMGIWIRIFIELMLQRGM